MAVLTVSDTRTRANDTSGDFLAGALAGQASVCARDIVIDDIYLIRAVLSAWIADTNAGRFDYRWHGLRRSRLPRQWRHYSIKPLTFGEVFRALSLRRLDLAIQSEQLLTGEQHRYFLYAGSTGACKTAWNIIRDQLDSEHRPCNFLLYHSGKLCP